MEVPLCSYLPSTVVITALWISSGIAAERTCMDYRGFTVESGRPFVPYANKPCIECTCIGGQEMLCLNTLFCIGNVDCSSRKWNNTYCCRKNCTALQREFYADQYGMVRRFQAEPKSDPQKEAVMPSNQYSSIFDYQGIGLDDYNATYFSPKPPGSVPSPYYPVLIGLISCAPVALCIVCVNAARKYFGIRSHLPRNSLWLRRGRRGERRTRTARTTRSAPTVFTDPPPNYADLTGRGSLSEKLPKYEDVIKHDEADRQKIFATVSSAQFSAPERVYLNHAFHPESSEATGQCSTTPSVAVEDEVNPQPAVSPGVSGSGGSQAEVTPLQHHQQTTTSAT